MEAVNLLEPLMCDSTIDATTRFILGDYNEFVRILKNRHYLPSSMVEITQGIVSCIAYISKVGTLFYKKWYFETVYDFLTVAQSALARLTKDDNLEKAIQAIFDADKIEEQSREIKIARFVAGTAVSLAALPGYDSLGGVYEEEMMLQVKAHFNGKGGELHRDNQITIRNIAVKVKEEKIKFQAESEAAIKRLNAERVAKVMALDPRRLSVRQYEAYKRSLAIRGLDPSLLLPKPERTSKELLLDVLQRHFASTPLVLRLRPSGDWVEFLLGELTTLSSQESADSEFKAYYPTVTSVALRSMVAVIADPLRAKYEKSRSVQLSHLREKTLSVCHEFFETSPEILLMSDSGEWKAVLEPLCTRLVESSLPGDSLSSLYQHASAEDIVSMLTDIHEQTRSMFQENKAAQLAAYREELTLLLAHRIQTTQRVLLIPTERSLLLPWLEEQLHQICSRLDANHFFVKATKVLDGVAQVAFHINEFVVKSGEGVLRETREQEMQKVKEVIILGMGMQYQGMDLPTLHTSYASVREEVITQMNLRVSMLGEDVPLRQSYEDLQLPQNAELMDAMLEEAGVPLSAEKGKAREEAVALLQDQVTESTALLLDRAVDDEDLHLDMKEHEQLAAVRRCLLSGFGRHQLSLPYLRPGERKLLVTNLVERQVGLLKLLVDTATTGLLKDAASSEAGTAGESTPAYSATAGAGAGGRGYAHTPWGME